MRLKLIGIALLAGMQAQLAAAQPVIQAVAERPRIVVEGYGEVKTAPDLAIITYTIRGEGSASDDAVRAMTTRGASIEAAIRNIDDDAEPLTSEVKVTPVRSDDCKETDYGSPQLSSGACAVLGYVATQAVKVYTKAVNGAGTMVGLIGRGGAFDAQIDSFELQDPHAAQQRALASALLDASTKAAAIAAASRVTLGTLLNISTARAQRDGEIVVTGSRRRPQLNELPAAAPPVAVDLTPESITTSADVTVTYAIGL
jgi:uncharacterized protein YggE